jgi:hypothetical protein
MLRLEEIYCNITVKCEQHNAVKTGILETCYIKLKINLPKQLLVQDFNVDLKIASIGLSIDTRSQTNFMSTKSILFSVCKECTINNIVKKILRIISTGRPIV